MIQLAVTHRQIRCAHPRIACVYVKIILQDNFSWDHFKLQTVQPEILGNFINIIYNTKTESHNSKLTIDIGITIIMPSRDKAGKKKKQKKAVGKCSGQTDDERRKLRSDQRTLLKNVSNNDGIEDAENDAFDNIRSENNDLFNKVRFAREAVLDGENFEAITSRASKQADSLVSVARYDVNKFVRKLQSKFQSSGNFDWGSIGRDVGVCFNSVALMSFLNGPLDKETTVKKIVRQRRERNRGEEGEAEKPEQFEKLAKSKDRASAAEKHFATVAKTLEKHCRKELDDESEDPERKKAKRVPGSINMAQFLFNPDSFTETVENIFHFSFMVKQNKAGVAFDDKQGAPVAFQTTVAGEVPPPARQAIVTVDMKSWKDLVSTYDVDSCYVPSRIKRKK